MLDSGVGLTIREVYDRIIAQDLYQFKADDPLHIVRNEIRRHCLGLDFSSASPIKLFQMTEPGKYFLLEKPVRRPQRVRFAKSRDRLVTFEFLKRDHGRFLKDFKARVIQQLQGLSGQAFERFCRNLLRAYGFRSVKVTRVSKDGGIDGFGQLKVGFAYFNVAFQCKRWKGSVGRPEISQFRGDIQGAYEMGIFFTSSSFTTEAKGSSMKTGAVPLTLIDGETIVEIMCKEGFGVEKEELPIYKLALDLALAEDYEEPTT
jgi:restriction system protein